VRPLFQKQVPSVLRPEFSSIPIQIISSKLIEYEDDDQSRFGIVSVCVARRCAKANKGENGKKPRDHGHGRFLLDSRLSTTAFTVYEGIGSTATADLRNTRCQSGSSWHFVVSPFDVLGFGIAQTEDEHLSKPLSRATRLSGIENAAPKSNTDNP
jgi:hypothetical protein